MHISDLTLGDTRTISLKDIYLSEENRLALEQVLKEFKYKGRLEEYGLPVQHKILLYGPSGCGKTMTASAIAKGLGKKLYILHLSNLVSSRIGETGQHLKSVFDKANREQAVLFLDEFDHIGKARGADDKDVGEMRRLVNSLIQLIDHCSALLIAATNHVEILDPALIRRFQVRLSFDMPTKEQLDQYYDHIVSPFPEEIQGMDRVYGISYAEAQDLAYRQIKSKLISQWELD